MLNKETIKEIIKVLLLSIVIYIVAFTDYVKGLNTIILFTVV
jgi:hypothetical protein